MFCTNCGSKMEPNAKFCVKCGAPAMTQPEAPAAQPEQVPPPPEQMPQPPEQTQKVAPTEDKKTRIWLSVVVIVGVLAIVIGGIVFLLISLFGSDTEEPTHEPVPPIADVPDVPPRPPEPPTGPVVEPPPLIDLPDIPGAGGEITVEEATVFHFIPDESGIWIFTTSDNTGDPKLEIFNEYGVTVAEDDDSAGFLNARISVQLDAGHRYTVHARFFFEDGVGSYLLTVELE